MSHLTPNNRFQFIAIILMAAIATIWLGLLGRVVWQQMAPVNQLPEQSTELSQPRPPTEPSAPIAATPIPDSPPATPSPEIPTVPTFELPDNPPAQGTAPAPTARDAPPKFNHLPYEEARGRLTPVGYYYDRSELMVEEAAQAFSNMKDNAQQAGIKLGPISGFRTVSEQQKLFTRQVKRHDGSEQEAARLSAPPGYSEHHTGYTVDIRDRDAPDTDLKYAMKDTRAYEWLQNNACQYGFELSFPNNNPQGVSFEPWHWRYVGSPTAQKIFANARQRYPTPSNCA